MEYKLEDGRIVREIKCNMEDGREVIAWQSIVERFQSGQVVNRQVVSREMIGDITEQEANMLAKSAGWI